MTPMSGRRAGQRFDAEYGVTTEAMFFLSDIDGEHLDRDAVRHATHYEPVAIDDFEQIMEHVPEHVIRDATFVDVGCGLGRAVFLAMRYPFKRIVGIELSSGLYESCRSNLRAYARFPVKCADVRFVNGDARKFDYPSGDLVLFLYNPFDAEALRETLAQVARRENAVRTWLLYHTPEHAETADACGYLRLGVPEYVAVALPVDVQKDAHRHEVRQDRAAAVAHERQGDAGDRHDADGHADVDEDVEGEHRDESAR